MELNEFIIYIDFGKQIKFVGFAILRQNMYSQLNSIFYDFTLYFIHSNILLLYSL